MKLLSYFEDILKYFSILIVIRMFRQINELAEVDVLAMLIKCVYKICSVS